MDNHYFFCMQVGFYAMCVGVFRADLSACVCVVFDQATECIKMAVCIHP